MHRSRMMQQFKAGTQWVFLNGAAGGLGLVLCAALVLRGLGLGYDLPYIYHPDEPVYINIIQRILQGDLNPHFFQYPTLFFYLNALISLPAFGLMRLLGYTGSVLPTQSLVMGSTLAQTPEAVWVNRGLSVAFGLGAVALMFLLARSLTRSAWAGVLAALLLAVSPTAVKINRFITPDTYVVFFVLAAVYFSLRLYRRGKVKDYILAGICAGLAASSKYNGGLVALAPFMAHMLRWGWRGLFKPSIYYCGVVCGLAFLAGSPFVALDFNKFWADFTYEARHYSTGHAGMEGDTLNWYTSYLWMVEGVGAVLGVVGMAAGLAVGVIGVVKPLGGSAEAALRTREALKEGLVVFGFPVVYFAFISSFVVRNDRTLLPVIPFLLLACTCLLWACLRGKPAPSTAARVHRFGAMNRLVAIVALGLALAVPVLTFAQYSPVLEDPVPAVQARQWIEANLPAGTRIAIESYAPYLDPKRYQVVPVFRASDKDVSWYWDNNIQYIVLAKAMYGRFYCDYIRYYTERKQYDRLSIAYPEAVKFTNPIPGAPLAGDVHALSARFICPPQVDLIYTHEIRILKVR